MVDKIKEFWHDQIPGWLPIFLAIVSAAFWIGQQQQSINDRLKSVEEQVKAIQDYLRHDHLKDRSEMPPISSRQQDMQQEAVAPD